MNKADTLKNLDLRAVPQSEGHCVIHETKDGFKKERFKIATVNLGLLNKQGARDRTVMFAKSPEMIGLLQDTLSTLDNMTTEQFETGADKPIRDRITTLLDSLNST